VQASTHKKIVFAGLGCGGFLILIWAAILIFGSKLDVEDRPGSRQYTPAQAAAALDSLGRLDVPALAALPPFDQKLLPAAPAGMTVVWRDTTDVFAVAFLDTFPSTSGRHKTWLEAGEAVDVETVGPGMRPPKSVPPPSNSLVRGRMLLSATRRLINGRDAGATLTLRSALLLARDLESRTDLSRQRIGARLERDALDMMSREPRLGGTLAPRARERLMRLDSALTGLTTLSSLIEAAGAGPADAATLATWVREPALPLAVRDEMLRAVGYGWVYNPPEVAYGMSATRSAALDSLRHAGLPEALVPTLEAIEALGKPGMTRRMTFSVQYRIERETP
jgi:hypothetical protein